MIPARLQERERSLNALVTALVITLLGAVVWHERETLATFVVLW